MRNHPAFLRVGKFFYCPKSLLFTGTDYLSCLTLVFLSPEESERQQNAPKTLSSGP